MLKKWQANMGNAAQAYTDGVKSVQQAPGQSAAQQQNAMVTRWNQAVQSGAWAQNTAAVSLSDWQAAAVNKGASRLVDGAQKGAAKFQRYAQQAAPVLAQIKQTVRAMPNGTDAERQARYQAAQTMLKQLKGIGRG